MVKVERLLSLIYNDSKRFCIGSKIKFVKYNYETDKVDVYIGEISNINEMGYIELVGLTINDESLDGVHKIYFEHMHKCDYVEA